MVLEGVLATETLDKRRQRRPGKLGIRRQEDYVGFRLTMVLLPKEMLDYELQEELNSLHNQRLGVKRQ
jgi:hypothetical protein